MGKNKKKRVFKRDFKEPREDVWVERRKKNGEGGYETAPTESPAFEEYYKMQGMVPEGDWDTFMESLKTPLPTTFRINGTGKFATDLRNTMESDFFAKLDMSATELSGEPIEAPRPLSWYPNRQAWQLRYSRSALRKLEPLSEIHELLKRENQSGGITRQEAVSMAPPLFLDLHPHHSVLDTCAAPGSKTAQMLDMLHANSEIPSGFVVANDVDAQRCNLLVHQTKRMNSPALMVASHDATAFPLVSEPGKPKAEAFYFDRILCDVPCSGDGTLRKAPDLWRRWNPQMGTGLHPLQVRITLHTAGLLKVGGRMVYSTCSFNPLEDEAVVAEVLRQSKGALELVDVSDLLPDFKRHPGKKTWQVRSSKGPWYSTFAEANEAKNALSFSESMFPEEDTASMPLERCMRVLPHLGDTGGFFIAVLKKVDNLPKLQPDRWRKLKEKLKDSWAANGKQQNTAGKVPATSTQPTQPPNKAAEQLEVPFDDAPQNPVDATVSNGAPKSSSRHDTAPAAEGQASGEQPVFREELVDGADEAADAAVVFADALIEQDADEAMEAADNAADAAEHMVDVAESGSRGKTPEGSAIGETDPTAESKPQAQDQPAVGSEREQQENIQAAKEDLTSLELEQEPKPVAAEQPQNQEPKKRQRQRRVRPGEEPLSFYTDQQTLDSIGSFFGLKDSFPLRAQLVARSGLESTVFSRKLYLISKGLREMVVKDQSQAVKVVSAGLKVFDRNDKKDPKCNTCPYRISQDGLFAVLPHMTRQVLRLTATELLRLIKERYVAVPASQSLQTDEKPGEGERPNKRIKAEAQAAPAVATENPVGQPEATDTVKEEFEHKGEAKKIPLSDLETIRQLEDIQGGCAICTLRDGEAQQLDLEGEGAEAMAVVTWRGRTSLTLLVDKATATQMAEKLETAIKKFAAGHAPA